MHFLLEATPQFHFWQQFLAAIQQTKACTKIQMGVTPYYSITPTMHVITSKIRIGSLSFE